VSEKLRPKPRSLPIPRVNRNQTLEIHDEGSAWAISYADLLMVLMSFFIIFFSFSDKEKSSKFEEIASAIKNRGAGGAISSGVGTGSGQGLVKGERMISSIEKMPPEARTGPSNLGELISKKVGGSEKTNVSDTNKIVIHFDDDIYSSAGFRLNDEVKTEVKSLVESLKPFMEGVKIVVVGHTDSRKLIPRSDTLRDNFDLSSLRAMNALRYLVELGIPVEKVSAKAAAQYERGSRSLSMMIEVNDE
jgi:chemotaxis protein MotB